MRHCDSRTWALVALELVVAGTVATSLFLPWFRTTYVWIGIPGPERAYPLDYYLTPAIIRAPGGEWSPPEPNGHSLSLLMTGEMVLVGLAVASSVVATAFVFLRRPSYNHLITASFALFWIALIHFYLNIVNALSDSWNGFMDYWNFSGDAMGRSTRWIWGPEIGWWLLLAAALVQTVVFALIVLRPRLRR